VFFHQLNIARVATDNRQIRFVAAIEQRTLLVHKAVHHGDLMPRGQQTGSQNGADITGSAGDEYFHGFKVLPGKGVMVRGSRFITFLPRLL